MSEKSCMNCGTSGCDHADAMRCSNGRALWSPKEFRRENRYIVLKRKDVDGLPYAVQRELLKFVDKVEGVRTMSGRPPLSCIVVESDWPEYEPVWEMIERRVSGKA